MFYSVWLDGNRIGDTALELRHGLGRRAGVFHPTEFGLTVLPGITAMAPALFDMGRMCRENGIDTEDPDFDIDGAADGIFATPEGRRLIAAAKEISRLELQDASGRIVHWDSILISDMTDFARIAAKGRLDAVAKRTPDAEEALADQIGGSPVRYFISTKICGGLRTRLPHNARTLVS
jgi:hypothetical protein